MVTDSHRWSLMGKDRYQYLLMVATGEKRWELEVIPMVTGGDQWLATATDDYRWALLVTDGCYQLFARVTSGYP